MASEGIPAPGAIISLITLQKIRYEGRLVNIDMANSTLKLEDSEFPSSRFRQGTLPVV